ncbi:MAG: hypothetical protein ACHREM_26720, partial [Polyangiales bacterium]
MRSASVVSLFVLGACSSDPPVTSNTGDGGPDADATASDSGSDGTVGGHETSTDAAAVAASEAAAETASDAATAAASETGASATGSYTGVIVGSDGASGTFGVDVAAPTGAGIPAVVTGSIYLPTLSGEMTVTGSFHTDTGQIDFSASSSAGVITCSGTIAAEQLHVVNCNLGGATFSGVFSLASLDAVQMCGTIVQSGSP